MQDRKNRIFCESLQNSKYVHIRYHKIKKSILKHHQQEWCRKVSFATRKSHTEENRLSSVLSLSFWCFLPPPGSFGPCQGFSERISRRFLGKHGRSDLTPGSSHSGVKRSEVEQTESCRVQTPALKTDTMTNPSSSSASETTEMHMNQNCKLDQTNTAEPKSAAILIIPRVKRRAGRSKVESERTFPS